MISKYLTSILDINKYIFEIENINKKMAIKDLEMVSVGKMNNKFIAASLTGVSILLGIGAPTVTEKSIKMR